MNARTTVAATRWMMLRTSLIRPAGLGAVVLVVSAIAGASGAKAETPAQLCQRRVTDDTLRKIPPGLVPQVNALFHAQMPAEAALASSVFRCDRGRVLVCITGANLPCGKANTAAPNPGAAEWCAQHPGSPDIPAYATGHDTVYEWRCHEATAEIVRQVQSVDRRGFIAEYWKPVP